MIIPQRREARAAGRTLALALLLSAARGPGLSTPASAATGDLGFAGRSTSTDDSAATGEKPESKLWCNCGAGATLAALAAWS
jgi:hypothetical protein